MSERSLHEFRILLAGWHSYLQSGANANWPGHEGFTRAVLVCAQQLSDTIDRAAGLEPWVCMGCGAGYVSGEHVCPMPVKPLTGGIGIYGLDWTYG